MICTSHHTLLGWSNQEEWVGWCMWHVGGRRDIHAGVWWGNL